MYYHHLMVHAFSYNSGSNISPATLSEAIAFFRMSRDKGSYVEITPVTIKLIYNVLFIAYYGYLLTSAYKFSS